MRFLSLFLFIFFQLNATSFRGNLPKKKSNNQEFHFYFSYLKLTYCIHSQPEIPILVPIFVQNYKMEFHRHTHSIIIYTQTCLIEQPSVDYSI